MKTIVVYYGYGDHTRMIAEKIQKELSCDILEIKPKVPYSTDYQTVVAETENNLEERDKREIEEININIEEYDKIIIGTPVWWYTITPPMRTFLNQTDFTGKKVYAFATNAGWLGETFTEIKELVGNVESSLSIKFSTDSKENKLITKEKEIDEWINQIKIEK